MTRLECGLLVWAILFFPAELLAHFWGRCPWPTLSRTVWDGIAWWHPVAYFVAIFAVVLLGHFEFRWSAAWLIVVAASLSAAVLVHLAVR